MREGNENSVLSNIMIRNVSDGWFCRSAALDPACEKLRAPRHLLELFFSTAAGPCNFL
jgi:hypothetical protein